MTGFALFAVTTVLAAMGLTLASRGEMPLVSVNHVAAGEARARPALVAAGGLTAEARPAGSLAGIGRLTTLPDDGRLAVVRSPRIDPATIERVLRQYSSPAAGDARAIFDLGEQYGIDPAVCLAFFVVESAAGTRGMATETRSLGNIRATPGYVNHKGYRKYATWREGIEDWYRLIAHLYVGEWNLTTVEAIVPVYAPAEDGNDPARYASAVRALVNEWRAARQVLP